ncbi:ComEA family DNA-binding protein [Cohnella algarum]|uniref:ComEA family DNA-binding protein n=1 Tax=Cohnella algarum TaxID=2044859 RepID=UPI001967CF0A|nr:helix-hairpin-helix domain-containing protein [Cohnella algarum]MBN2983263.1 helix-hairpin-helix domain-containing protein [Cohnella algarum]
MRNDFGRGSSAARKTAVVAAAAAVLLLGFALSQPTKNGELPEWQPVNGAVAKSLDVLRNGEASEQGNPPASPLVAAAATEKEPGAPASPDNSSSGTDPEAAGSQALSEGAASQPADSAEAGARPAAAANSPTSAGGTDVKPSEDSAAAGEQAAPAVVSGRMNINAATAEQLDELPGIGPSKANAIVEYREANGRFKTVEELKNVKGIGDKLFADIRDWVAIGAP